MLADMFPRELVAPETFRPISRREYDQMVELGMFENEKIELLRGALVTMSPQKLPHARVVQWLNAKLVHALNPRYAVRPQLPFAADDWSEPEPDFVVTHPEQTVHGHPSDVLLVIEVSDSSLRKDRVLKLEIYAEAKVPEYWIIDVNTMTVTVHTEPIGDRYARIVTLRDGDVLRPTLLPDLAIAVAEIPR